MTFIPTEADNLRAIRHVNFEVQNFTLLSAILVFNDDVINKTPLRNIVLSYWVILFRSTKDFFKDYSSKSPDDILAYHFLINKNQLVNIRPVNLDAEAKRANKMAAHLTYSRDENIDNNTDKWNIPKIYQEIVTKFNLFITTLENESPNVYSSKFWKMPTTIIELSEFYNKDEMDINISKLKIIIELNKFPSNAYSSTSPIMPH